MSARLETRSIFFDSEKLGAGSRVGPGDSSDAVAPMEGEEQVKQRAAQEPQPARGRAPGYQPLLGAQVEHPAPIQRRQAQECLDWEKSELWK